MFRIGKIHREIAEQSGRTDGTHQAGERQPRGGAASGLLRGSRSAVRLGDRRGDGQTEPGTAVGAARPLCQTWIRCATAVTISATASSTGTPFFCSPLRYRNETAPAATSSSPASIM